MTNRGLTTGAIIVAAGSSRRMGGVDKLLQPLDGRPVIAYSIAAFAAATHIEALAIVASPANIAQISVIARQLAPQARVVLGGERRQDSVREGIEAVGNVQYVVIHDAARPLVTTPMIESTLEAAQAYGAAIMATPVTDTVKQASRHNMIERTVPRDGLWLAQTPQAFDRQLLLRAHAQATGEATDDAALVEALGKPVALVMGTSRNLKLTTLDDLHVAEALLQRAGVGE